MKTLIRRLIMFFVGFCLYITIEVCFRGYSYPVMGLCGGIILLFLDMINEKISWDLDLLIQGGIGSGMITLTELFVGEIWKFFELDPMWDYSDMPLNFDGVICLPFSLIWILVSIVGIFVADAVNYYVFKLPPIPYYRLFGRMVIKFKK